MSLRPARTRDHLARGAQKKMVLEIIVHPSELQEAFAARSANALGS